MTMDPAPRNPAARPSLGRALGETSRLVGKLHQRALAGFGTDFPTWMLLALLSEIDGPAHVEWVQTELARRADMAPAEVARVLERSATAGHVGYRPENDPATAELTEQGAAHFGALYRHSREVTDAAFEGIAAEDVTVALRVLRVAGERAATALG